MKPQLSSDSFLHSLVTLKRLIFPSLIFFFFLAFLLSHEELTQKFLGNVSEIIILCFYYGSQIGLWLSAAFLVQRLFTVFLWDGLITQISGRPVPRLPKDITGMVVFGIAGMGVLATVFDQSVTGIWATSGIMGIVVGIALRNVILDVFIGLSMHVEQPFRIGDWVMIHQNRRETHIVGKVIEINWRTTRLKTTEKNMVVVPNNKMGEAILTNYMEPKPHFRMNLKFALDYSVQPDRAIRVLLSGVTSLVDDKRILSDPKPEVRLEQALPHGQMYDVRFFILPANVTPKESKHIVNKAVIEHLAFAGMTPSMEKERIFMDRTESLPILQTKGEEKFPDVVGLSDLASVLTEKQRDKLKQFCVRFDLEAGETLYRQGNQGNTMYWVAEGLLSSFCHLSGFEGQAKVEHVEVGSHFGEECALGENLRTSTVTAMTDTIVFSIDAKNIQEIAAQNGSFLSMLNKQMGLNLNKIEEKKKGIRSKGAKRASTKRKVCVSGAIQTFFADLFPSGESSETNLSS